MAHNNKRIIFYPEEPTHPVGPNPMSRRGQKPETAQICHDIEPLPDGNSYCHPGYRLNIDGTVEELT